MTSLYLPVFNAQSIVRNVILSFLITMLFCQMAVSQSKEETIFYGGLAGAGLIYLGVKSMVERSENKFKQAVAKNKCEDLSNKKRSQKCQDLVVKNFAKREEEDRRKEEIRIAKDEEENRKRIAQTKIDSISAVNRAEKAKREAMDRAEKEARIQREIEERRAEIMRKFGKTDGLTILEGKVRLGFSREMCLEAWGHPDDTSRTIMQGIVSEYWVYYRDYKSWALWFVNGKLDAIQD